MRTEMGGVPNETAFSGADMGKTDWDRIEMTPLFANNVAISGAFLRFCSEK